MLLSSHTVGLLVTLESTADDLAASCLQQRVKSIEEQEEIPIYFLLS